MKIVNTLEPKQPAPTRCVTFADVPVGGVFKRAAHFPAVKQELGQVVFLEHCAGKDLLTRFAAAGGLRPDSPVTYYPDAQVVLGEGVTKIPEGGKL